MPDQELAKVSPTVGQQGTQSTATEAIDYGFNSDQQCALAEGCADSDVPALDDVFWDGFTDEHGGLVADIHGVAGRAMELASQVPSPQHAALLDVHIDACWASRRR